MASHSRDPRVRVDDDGVRTLASPARRSVWVVVAAIGVPIVVTIVAITVIRLAPAAAPPATGREPVATREPVAAPALPRDERAPEPLGEARPQLKAIAAPVVPRPRGAPRPAEQPNIIPTPIDHGADDIDARDAIPALIEAGETGGITVFPLPGTKPIKRGLIVPEDFELPEGYVRHYQTTDDGQPVPPILMFHPDYDFVDSHGEPIAVPPDRVVPDELAPPGMPRRRLEAPATARGAGAP